MKFLFSVILFQWIGICFFADRACAESGDEVVEKWIDELSSDSFPAREKASRELWKLGKGALPALRKALLSEDPERALRAAEALDKVELRITPETSEKVLALIQSYRNGPENQKLNILNSLKREKAYYQVLKLFDQENPQEQVSLETAIQGTAILGARNAILDEDYETAIDLLRMTPAKHNELMALAYLYENRGRVDEQLANMDPPKKVAPVVWRGFLLRAKGDLTGALEQVEKTSNKRLLAGLKVIAGDPVLWLEQNGSGVPGEQAQEAYIDAALKLWRNEKLEERDFAPLYKLLESSDKKESAHAMSSLAALGKLERVEEIQNKKNPLVGFVHYLSSEEIDLALEVLGLDPKQPDFPTWVSKRFDQIAHNRDAENVTSELLTLAGFLERRGLEQELEDAFSKPLLELADKNEGDYLELLQRFFESGMGAPQFASQHAAKWAGEDKARWDSIFATALGEEQMVSEWLGWIREIKPTIKHPETLEAMLAIFQQSTHPGSLREEWLKRAWKMVEEEKDETTKKIYVKRILSLCIVQQDVTNSLKAWDMLDGEERADAAWGSIDKYLSAAGRWDDAAELLGNMMKGQRISSPEMHAYLAATLRRAGEEKQAKVHDDLAKQLALGYAPSSLRIGAYYAYAGDFERAAEWYRRAVIQADVSEGEFVAALIKFAETNLRQRNWKIAAACHEVIAQVYASEKYKDGALSDFAKARMSADLSRSMATLPDQRETALETLRSIHQQFKTDGILADDFFPALKEAGLEAELKIWFAESWDWMTAVIEKYPKSHNSRNTAAWFAARARLKLAEAEKLQEGALALAPEQAAYLDTMAELKFAQGDRKSALKWSNRSVSFEPFDDMIRFQNERFRNSPLPKN